MTYNYETSVFVETTHFTHWICKYLSDEEYSELQQYLMENPEIGKIISGAGGLRKLRWSRQGIGKSGGMCLIYYWAKTREQIYMLTAYSKSERENIDSAILAKIAKQLETIK